MADDDRQVPHAVDVDPGTQHVLMSVMLQEDVTMAEALRRLVGYGYLVYGATRLRSGSVIIDDGDRTRQVICAD